jgi:hypothetical protein
LHFVVRQISASSNGHLDGFISWNDFGFDFDRGMAEVERLSNIFRRRFSQLYALDVLTFGGGGPRRAFGKGGKVGGTPVSGLEGL